jgi:NAD(P)H-hydrate epimerase
MRYVSAKEIAGIDRLAQRRFCIPSLILMENAGRVAAEEILKSMKRRPGRKAAVFCGKGNNGGDGFVAARHLACEGVTADIFLIGKARDIKKPDPLVNLKIIRKMRLKISEITGEKGVEKLKRSFRYDAIVDAIFGTGFTGGLSGHMAGLVDFLNGTGRPIFSLDVPSGLDATTGKVETTCVKAARTITFGLPKKGFIKSAGPRYTGKVTVRNISYPGLRGYFF